MLKGDKMKAKIFEIKKFAVHDGDGIRTTVFFKGCPLKCVWCHNPEGIGFKPQLAYYKDKCIGCGECLFVCHTGAHNITDKGHVFDRQKCEACGNCKEVCLGDALMFYGKEMTVEEIVSVVLEDREFYETSGGGVTLSGGECLMQADFCAELLKRLKEASIHTAVDTCGFVSREIVNKVIDFTDVFLYDVKAFDNDVHIKCTGYTNDTILDNLKYIDNCGKNIEIRIPYVPEHNSGQIEKIGRLLMELKNVTKVRLLPYHNYAGSKYMSLDMENTLPEVLPTEKNITCAKQVLKDMGLNVVE